MMRQLESAWTRSIPSVLLVTAATAANAASITVQSVDMGGNFPAGAEIVAATPAESSFGDDADASLAQSFTVVDPLSLRRIFLMYQNDDRAPGDKALTMTISRVADVDAATHDDPPLPADVLLTDSVTFPYVDGVDTIAAITLDAPLDLAAGGYLLRFSGTTNPGWEWFRTTAGSGGSVYAGGKGYEDGVEKDQGGRDFSLALSSVPEPSSVAMILSAAFGLLLAPQRLRRLV
ncbi:hypothetical protein Pla175_48730 [Pirellulimonas nuda]|uniref:PEP-CTERM protein-sorting domain-containing protein n=1 Tax=Pirellulimonas nuda TaxID=2528009 RepID=A0A518DIZ0_9BACT|nr:hypothetical protein [Pirellulimonas nuda]QDU91445.1 hypothetical protein Pla175_48730 [Pirellulimonas nuda]